MKITTTSTPAESAAEKLNQILSDHKNEAVLLMLSGGSALTILDHVDATVLGPRLTITTLDERYSTDPTINNFAQIAATQFFARAQERGAACISTTILEHESLEAAGRRFGTELHTWKDSNPNAVIIATMGVGPDGHTAGIFPHQKNVDFETDEWVMAYELTPGTNPYPSRVTVTPTFLKTQVNSAVAFITGEEKRVILNKLQDPHCVPNDVPACLIKDLNDVVIITDLQ